MSTFPTPGLEGFAAHQAVLHHCSSVVIRYHIAIDGPVVELAHADLDPSLSTHTVRITTAGTALELRSDEWISRTGDVSAHVLGWMLGHIDLRGTRVRPGARHYDEEWMDAWRRANPLGM